MHKPMTYLKRHLVQNGYKIIGKGSLAIITESENPSYALKFTNCSATVSYLSTKFTRTRGIRLMEAELVEVFNIYGVDEDIYVFRIPRLYPITVSELNVDQLALYRGWTAYLKHVRCSINYFSALPEQQLRVSAVAVIKKARLPKAIKREFGKFLASLADYDEGILDTKVRGNIMLDSKGNLVINDPVFNRDTWSSNVFY